LTKALHKGDGSMALSEKEKTTIRQHLGTQSNVDDIVGQLKTGAGQKVTEKYLNFDEIKWWLKSALMILTDDTGVREAADIIQEFGPKKPVLVIETAPPPPLDIAKEKKKVTDDCGHATTIRTIYVQLDDAQNKHQPPGVPIGTRQTSGGQKFGTYATKTWHELHTMPYMARWAEGLTGMAEGKKVEHGQMKKVPIEGAGNCSFEGFCILLGGTKYVSFHCYPNSR
jgi:hypothetical protein